jgi:hypothetical protein
MIPFVVIPIAVLLVLVVLGLVVGKRLKRWHGDNWIIYKNENLN